MSLRGDIERGGGCLGGWLSLDAVRLENDGEKREGGGAFAVRKMGVLGGWKGGSIEEGAEAGRKVSVGGT